MSKENVQKRLFAVEDYFRKMEDEKGNRIFVSIPFFDVVKGQKTAILVDKNSANFALKDFWKNFKYNYYAAYSFYHEESYTTSSEESISCGQVEPFEKASFFDVGEITRKDSSIPIFDIWNEAYAFSKIDNQEIEKFKNILSRFDVKLKSEFLVSISNFIPSITKLNHEFLFELNQIHKTINENWYAINDDEILELLKKTIDVFSVFRDNTVLRYLNFYEKLFAIYKEYQKRLESPLYIDFKADIKDKLIQLKTINSINRSSLSEVETNFVIRDLYQEISLLKIYKKDFKKATSKYIKYVIYKINCQIRAIKYKMEELSSNSKDFKRLLYQEHVKKHILKIWKRNYNKLLYLKKREILEIDKNIRIEEKYFMSNLQAYSRFKTINIAKRISKSFYFEFKNYNWKSKMYLKNLNKNILERQEKIKELEVASFHKIYDLERKIEEKNFHDDLKLSQAEYNWDKKTSENNFKISLTYNYKRAKKFFDNILASKKEQLTVAKNIVTLVRKKYDVDGSINPKIYRKMSQLTSIEVGYSHFTLTDVFLNNLLNFSSSKNKKVSKKFIRDFVAVQKMLSATDSTGLELKEFIVPYNNLSLVDKIKLKLIKFILEKPLLVFVQDDISLSDAEQRIEFFKVLNSLSYKYGFTYVFVTEDLALVEKYFDYVSVLFNNCLVESGYVKDLKQKPIHPYTKSVFKKIRNFYEIRNAEKMAKEFKPWIYSDLIELEEERHFLFSSSKEFQIWNKSAKKSEKEIQPSWHNLKETSSQTESNYIESHYRSQLDGLETMLITTDTTKK